MENNELLAYISQCDTMLNPNSPLIYEASFFKIYVKFEQYLAAIFEKYCVGEASGKGFTPIRKLEFNDETHLRAVLKGGDKQYIDYIKKIENLSKHIFDKDPFNIIYQVAEHRTIFDQMQSLRNYIAHESPESKARYIKSCLGGGAYIEPAQYLMKIKRGQSKSNYTIYIEAIKNISELLLDEPIV